MYQEESMKKVVFPNPIVNVVIGVILIAFAIVALPFIYPALVEDFIEYVVAVLIAAISLKRYLKGRNAYQNKNAFMILTAEVAVALLLAVLLAFDTLGITLALGAVLYLRGVVYMLIMQLLNKKGAFEIFMMNLVILTLGAYIFFGSPDLANVLYWIIIVALFLYGVILLYAGVDQLRKKKA